MGKNNLSAVHRALLEVVEQWDDEQITFLKDLLAREENRLNLELAKVRVALDAYDRGCPDEVPPSIKVWLDKKEAEAISDLPIG